MNITERVHESNERTNKDRQNRCKQKDLTLMLTVIAANGDPCIEL